MLSVLLRPVSLAARRSTVGAAGATVSMVTLRAGLSADSFPAKSTALNR